MGRIKTTMVKRISLELVRDHKPEFKKEFEENKAVVEKFAEVRSKKLRNVITGYVTRLMKRKEEI